MVSLEELKSLKVSELRNLAKERNIQGRWEMNKQDLIDALSAVMKEELEEQNKKEVKLNMDAKMKYIKEMHVGTIIAFKTKDGRTKSAKVIMTNNEKQEIKLETKYGRSFEIKFGDVVWVRTPGSRWPRGVYKELKGEI